MNELVAIASEQVGAREEGHNAGFSVTEYQGATWLTPGPWPWCAAFCCWVLREWLQIAEGRAYLVSRGISSAEDWRCRDASAFGWIKWAKRQGLTVFDENHDHLRPRAGDFIVYDFSHIGIVEDGHYIQGSHLKVIEGNTSGRDEEVSDSETGDGVWRKVRPVKLVRAYIRL